jgi:glycosyltransferase involved in cell wall biosynthesis
VASVHRPRLLFIAFFFPPTRASGVYRARAIANHFTSAGWDVTVITPPREFFRDYLDSYDATLEPTVDPRVRVERVPFNGWHWEPNLRRYGVLRGNFPTLAAKWRRWSEELLFPELYAPWIPKVVARALKMHRRSPFDVVLATCNPYSSFAAARVIAKLSRVPYAIDFRDSWTVNQYTEEQPSGPARRRKRQERHAVAEASVVSFVNAAQREWHAAQYPESADQMIVVENGWEPELLGDVPAAAASANRPLLFSYVGTMTRYMPLELFFEGWRLARSEPALAGAVARMYGYLGFVRTGTATVRALLPDSATSGVEYRGSVAKAEVARVYAEADVLLLILPGSRMVTSGKVYEYMATGKPIVSVHVPESSASATLSGYPLWFPVTAMDPGAVRDALLRAAAAARDLRHETVVAGKRYAARFTRDAQLQPMEARLRTIIGADPDQPEIVRNAVPTAVHDEVRAHTR